MHVLSSLQGLPVEQTAADLNPLRRNASLAPATGIKPTIYRRYPLSTNTSNNAALTTDHATRRSTETKLSTKTTEFFVYIAAVLAVIITAAVVGDGTEGSDAGDLFDANQAMQYITYLTIGYMIARGLAKSGSREHYNDTK